MGIFASVIMLFLAFSACAFLQLVPSVFAVFCHYASGKKTSDKFLNKSSFFTIGTISSYAIMFVVGFLITLDFLFANTYTDVRIIGWILASIYFTISIFVLFFYYRKDGTKLFISRKLAHALVSHAKTAKKRSDIFTLGFVTGFCDAIFIFPVYIFAIYEIMTMQTSIILKPILMIFMIIVSILPTLAIRGKFSVARLNLAEIQRGREKTKNIHRILLAFSYLALAVTLVIFRLIK